MEIAVYLNFFALSCLLLLQLGGVVRK